MQARYIIYLWLVCVALLITGAVSTTSVMVNSSTKALVNPTNFFVANSVLLNQAVTAGNFSTNAQGAANFVGPTTNRNISIWTNQAGTTIYVDSAEAATNYVIYRTNGIAYMTNQISTNGIEWKPKDVEGSIRITPNGEVITGNPTTFSTLTGSGLTFSDSGEILGVGSFSTGSLYTTLLSAETIQSSDMLQGGIIKETFTATNSVGQTVTNTAVETTMFSEGTGTLTLPGNLFWSAGKKIYIRMAGNYWTPAVNTRDFKICVKFNSTVVSSNTVSSTILPVNQIASALDGQVAITCTEVNGTTGTFTIAGDAGFDVAISGVTVRGKVNLDNGGINFTHAIDSDINIDVTGTWSGVTAGNSVCIKSASVFSKN